MKASTSLSAIGRDADGRSPFWRATDERSAALESRLAVAPNIPTVDQVTASMVGAIATKMEQTAIERARCKPTENLDGYDYYLQGMAKVAYSIVTGLSAFA
jgi:hypothetical protein